MGIKLDAFEWADFITTGEKVDYSHLYDINILIDWLPENGNKIKSITVTDTDGEYTAEITVTELIDVIYTFGCRQNDKGIIANLLSKQGLEVLNGNLYNIKRR